MENKSDCIECTIPFDTADSCRRKIEHIRAAQKQRKMVSIEYRLEHLKKLLSLWDKYENEIHKSNYLDLGQSEFISKFTTFYQVRGEIVYNIDNLREWVKPKKCDTPLLYALADSYVKPEPFGVCLIFSAWNCNFLTLIIPIAQAIAAGNLVVAKPAATAPETMKVCMKILNEMSNDVVECCAGAPEVHSELLRNRFDLLIFTGSAKIGKIISQAAAQFLTPTILELGGQNPVIVEKTANLKTTAHNILFGRHTINGQACIAPEYIMCERSIYNNLVEELKKTYTQFYGEAPEKSEALGKMVNKKYTERIINLIKNPGEGAEILYGEPDKCNLDNRFISPILFGFPSLELMDKSELAKEEIFGPVLYMAPYDRLEETIDYMARREKPLASYLFTSTQSVKDYVRDNTTAGCFLINDTVIHFSSRYVPFGGVGHSGMGSYHGKWGFINMSHWKPVMDQAEFILSLRYPPYNLNQKKLINFALKNLNYGKLQFISWIKYLFIGILIFIVIMKFGKKMLNKN